MTEWHPANLASLTTCLNRGTAFNRNAENPINLAEQKVVAIGVP